MGFNKLLYLDEARRNTIVAQQNLTIGKLNWLFANSVVEFVFKRKNKSKNPNRRKGNRKYRRMLATSNWDFLNYYKSIVGFQIPSPSNKKGTPYYKINQIKLVFDLVDRDWKCFSTNNGDYWIAGVWVLNTDKKEWETFIKDYMTKEPLFNQQFQDKFANTTY